MTYQPAHARMLREARERAGMTGKQVADIIGVSDSTYRNAERGLHGAIVFKNLDKAFPEIAAEALEAYYAYKQSSTPPQAEGVAEGASLLLPIELVQGLAEAHVTRFHPSRKYYSLLREGRASISQYSAQAEHTLEFVSITLATGMELERVIDTFEDLIVRKHPVTITVSLLDPDLDYLAKSISSVAGLSPASLAMRIQDTIAGLQEFRESRLKKGFRHFLRLWAHASLPNASAIVIDGDKESGLIQLETNGYKMAREDSFGFEVRHGSEFYRNLVSSYRHLVRDGRKIV